MSWWWRLLSELLMLCPQPWGHFPTNINTLCATWLTCWGANATGERSGRSDAFLMEICTFVCFCNIFHLYPHKISTYMFYFSLSWLSSFLSSVPLFLFFNILRFAESRWISVNNTALKNRSGMLQWDNKMQPSVSSLRKKIHECEGLRDTKTLHGSLKYYETGFYNSGQLSQPRFTLLWKS